MTESSWTEEALAQCLSFFDHDRPRSLSEAASFEGKSERASIMDLTDILRDEEAAGSGGVGVFGGVGGSWGCVSVHEEDLRWREKEKKDLESELCELRVLPLLPGRDHRRGRAACSGRTMGGGGRAGGSFIAPDSK